MVSWLGEAGDKVVAKCDIVQLVEKCRVPVHTVEEKGTILLDLESCEHDRNDQGEGLRDKADNTWAVWTGSQKEKFYSLAFKKMRSCGSPTTDGIQVEQTEASKMKDSSFGFLYLCLGSNSKEIL